MLPALAYLPDAGRYAIESPAFYLAPSKNFQGMGFPGLHGGLSYSLERADGDTDPTLCIGIEKTIGPIASSITEYDMGMDPDHHAPGRGCGYLNMGLRLSIDDGLTIEFNLNDLFRNQVASAHGNRTLKVEYVSGFRMCGKIHDFTTERIFSSTELIIPWLIRVVVFE